MTNNIFSVLKDVSTRTIDVFLLKIGKERLYLRKIKRQKNLTNVTDLRNHVVTYPFHSRQNKN